MIAFDEYGCPIHLRLLVHSYTTKAVFFETFCRKYNGVSHYLLFPYHHYDGSRMKQIMNKYRRNFSHLKFKVDRLRCVLGN